MQQRQNRKVGQNAKGDLGKIIDTLFAISILTGLVTAICVNVPTIFGIISRVFSTLPGFFAQPCVIILWSVVFIPCFIIVLVVAQATGIDSAAYTLANISCREIGDGQEPPHWIRIF
ncbi:MAG: BCCT family transporter [Bacillota bacterium]|nr:BCCT family transporter [Bacillota bacterium]